MGKEKPNIVDQMIEKAANEIARTNWSGMEEPITEDDIDELGEELAQMGIKTDPQAAKDLLKDLDT